MLTTRRSLITGLASILAAPAIVRASSLMPVKAVPTPFPGGITFIDEEYDVALLRTRNGLIPSYAAEFIDTYKAQHHHLVRRVVREYAFDGEKAAFQLVDPSAA